MTGEVWSGVAGIVGALGLSEVVRRVLSASDRRYDRIRDLEQRIVAIEQELESERLKRFKAENAAQAAELKVIRLTDEIQALKARVEEHEQTIARLRRQQGEEA